MSVPETLGAGTAHRVELTLAADAEMLFLARMTGAAVATRAKFDFEHVEDLRLAIDELFVRLMSSELGRGPITLLFQWDDEGALEVTGTRGFAGDPATNGSQPLLSPGGPSHELSEKILDALVDDHGEDTSGGSNRAWLRMRRQGTLG
jgi:hypothetical protein